ncbi:MAG: acyl-CoA reductase, partial [Bacteroidota bacterium]
MNLQERIEVLVELGRQLKDKDDFLDALMQRTYHKNKWFTVKDQQQAIENITTNFLTQKALENWAAAYNIQEKNQQNIGLVLADSTPLAGFHDILSVFITGHHAQIKLPENDEYVLPYLIKLLSKINPATTTYFSVAITASNFCNLGTT